MVRCVAVAARRTRDPAHRFLAHRIPYYRELMLTGLFDQNPIYAERLIELSP